MPKKLLAVGLLLMVAFASVIVSPVLFQATNTVVTGEAVSLFGTAPRALLHPIKKVISVYRFNPTTGVREEYPSTAWQIVAGEIARSPGSPIYDFSDYAVTVDGNGKYALVTTPPRNPPVTMNLLAYVDYEIDPTPADIVPALAPAPVHGRLLTAGDSITGGAHTIAREFFNSDRDGYVGLIRDQFRNVFDVENFSFDGSWMGLLTDALPTILENPPEAMTVAFGQNDHLGGPSGLPSFKDGLTHIVTESQAAGVYVILVGFIRKNPNWVGYSPADALAYNAAIAEVATATGAPFVDIDTAWEQMKTVKTHLDLTGDNHHHPNNFGARVYFSAILPYLLSTDISSVDAPAYVALP